MAKTFASRAKALVKHYKRADWDPIEKKALERSLQSLQEEQEAFKAANGMETDNSYSKGGNLDLTNGRVMGNKTDFFSKGGYFHKYDGTENSVVQEYDSNGLPVMTDPIYGTNPGLPLISSPVMNELTYENPVVGVPMGTTNKGGFYDWSPSQKMALQTQGAPATGGSSPYSTSIAPSLISGGISTLGNLFLASQQKELPKLKLPRIAGEDVSYEPARQMAMREASRGNTAARYNIGRGARSRGEYLANVGAANAAISSSLGETLTKSKQEEILVNANKRMGMSQANAEMAAKEQMFNLQMKAKNKEDKEAYIAAALQNVGATTRDINAIQQQDALINALGEDYGWYMQDNPNAKWYQKKKTMVSKYKGSK